MKNIRVLPLLIGVLISIQGCVSDMIGMTPINIKRKYKTKNHYEITKDQAIIHNEIVNQREATALIREITNTIKGITQDTKNTIKEVKKIKKEL